VEPREQTAEHLSKKTAAAQPTAQGAPTPMGQNENVESQGTKYAIIRGR